MVPKSVYLKRVFSAREAAPDFRCLGLAGKPNRNVQIEEMRIAVADSFPEPNRRLLQR